MSRHLIVKRFLPNKVVLIVAGVGTLLLSLPFFFSLKRKKTYLCKGGKQDLVISIRQAGKVGIFKVNNVEGSKEQECPWVELSPEYKGYLCPTGEVSPYSEWIEIRKYAFFPVQENNDYFPIMIVREVKHKYDGKINQSAWRDTCYAFSGRTVGNYCISEAHIDCRRVR